MNKYTCCIGLCVFNSERGLPAVFRNLRALSARFQDVAIIFYYDHSKDNTLNLIQNFAADPDNRATILINRMSMTQCRTQNIANARNGILDEIRRDYDEVDFFIMMDANEYSCVGEMDLDTLEEVFYPDNLEKWDSVSFDREAGYYDFWALSFDEFVYSLWHFENTQWVSKMMRAKFNEMLHSYRARPQPEFIPVLSAFNGFAVYKTSRFLTESYSATVDLSCFPRGSVEHQMRLTGSPIYEQFGNTRAHPCFTNDGDCEHRRFHLDAIRNRGCKIRIYPRSVFRKTAEEVNGRGPA